MEEKIKKMPSLKQTLKKISLKIWEGIDRSVSWVIDIVVSCMPFFILLVGIIGLFAIFAYNYQSIVETRTFGTLELVSKAQFDSNAKYALSFKGDDGRTSVYKMTGDALWAFASTNSELEDSVADAAHRSILFNELTVGKKYMVSWCIYSDDREILYIKPSKEKRK